MNVVYAAAVDGVGEEAVDELPVDVRRVASEQLIHNLMICSINIIRALKTK